MTRQLLCSAIVAIAACGFAIAGDKDKKKEKDPAGTQPAAVNKFCAVMQEHEIDPTVTYEYKDKTIGFCCADCIPEFKKDPEKYVKTMK